MNEIKKKIMLVKQDSVGDGDEAENKEYLIFYFTNLKYR